MHVRLPTQRHCNQAGSRDITDAKVSTRETGSVVASSGFAAAAASLLPRAKADDEALGLGGVTAFEGVVGAAA
jgi:hypothetical protein